MRPLWSNAPLAAAAAEIMPDVNILVAELVGVTDWELDPLLPLALLVSKPGEIRIGAPFN